MRHLLIGITAAATIAVIGPAWAQVPPPVATQATWPPAASPAQRYAFPNVTPEDAYRDGLINRWQLEQYQGPTAQALQGPSPDGGNRGNGGGGGWGRWHVDRATTLSANRARFLFARW
jgi:hypothetical protein